MVAPNAERVLEVSEFYEALVTHLESEFGRRHPRWVRGEIEKSYEKGHLYLDVVDAGPAGDAQRPVLKVRCWASVWGPLKKDLAARGISLREGLVVSFRGYAGVYKPRGEIGFSVTEIDVEGLLGDVAKQRQELIERLQREGALEANKRVEVPVVPLRVGLVSSPRTEGFNDFTGQLLNSGFGFAVSLVAATVQGDSAPTEVVRAIALLEATDVDVICVVRGGGSRGDLAAFDDERVARAIAGCAKPVFTGIGHTGDVSVADLAAAHAAITPTKLGEHLVSLVAEWRERHVARPAERVRRVAEAVVDEATEYVGERRRTMMLAVRDRLGAEQLHLDHTAAALARHASHLIEVEGQRLGASRQLLGAYDPKRRLAQGWSIVTNGAGRVVRSLGDVRVGEVVGVRVSDGVFEAAVSEKKGESGG
jgi:exodeoxyribonuclease VII large subunit